MTALSRAGERDVAKALAWALHEQRGPVCLRLESARVDLPWLNQISL